MAKSKPNRRPAQSPQGNARRLGANNQQRAAVSAGAQRRAARAQKHRKNLMGWAAIGVVVLIVVVFIVVRLSGSNTPTNSASTGISTGDSPALASVTNMVDPVATIPLSVYNTIGTDSQPIPYQPTKDQPKLTEDNLPRLVYYGAEFCPYCAMVRWSIVAALSRFGTFTGLKVTSSAADDGNIPTFSFLNSSYVSKYVVFTPYEYLNRDQEPLQSVPSSVLKLYSKYDGSLTTNAAAAPFNPGSQAGIPFLDFANRLVSSGAPGFLDPVFNALDGGGPPGGAATIAQAIHDPSSSVGKAISAQLLVALANYFSAAICTIDGGQPSSVCNSSGVKAAMKVIASTKPVS